MAEYTAEPGYNQFHTNGTTSPDAEDGYTQAAIDHHTRANERLTWEDYDLDEFLTHMVENKVRGSAWFALHYLDALTAFFKVPWEWGRVKAVAKECGVHPPDLERAVAARLKLQQSPQQASAPPGDQAASVPPAHARFETITARELYAKELTPLKWIIPEILPAGLTLLTGRAKDGKSLLAWNLAMAVATGGTALGRYQVEAGDVLYLDLEDGERRAKRRLTDQMAHNDMPDPPERLAFVLWEAPRIGDGFEDDLTQWLDDHPETRLVIVDILEKVRPRRQPHAPTYESDYAAFGALGRIAQERNIAVVVVHHANKSTPEDWRDTISGSIGLPGAVDTCWSLQRIAGAPEAALRIIGRDVDVQDLALQFHEGFWTVVGDAEDYRRSKTSTDVLEVLRLAGKAMTPKQLAKALNIPEDTMRKHLRRMYDRGEVMTVSEGHYIPRSSPPPPPPEDDRDVDCATPATGATPATPRGDDVPPAFEWQDSGTQTAGSATPTKEGNSKELDTMSGRVAPVAPPEGHQEGRASGEASETMRLTAGDWCFLLTLDGCQVNTVPFQILTVVTSGRGEQFATFAETKTAWPLVRCERVRV